MTKALVAIGPKAVPALVGGFENTADQNSKIARAILETLGQMGTEARKATPALVTALKKLAPCKPSKLEKTLGQINARPGVELLAALSSKVSRERIGAACALILLRRRSKKGSEEAFRPLVRLVKEGPSRVLRRLCAVALGRFRVRSGVTALVGALEDPAVDVRIAAAAALGDMEVEKAKAAATLQAIFEDPKVRATRIEALSVLGRLGMAAKPAIPSLVKACLGKDFALLFLAEEALMKLEDLPVPSLVAALSDPDDSVRSAAANMLGRLGGHAKSAVPALIKVLEDNSNSVQSSAIGALGRIGVNSAAVRKSLKVFSEDQSLIGEFLRRDALRALAALEKAGQGSR